MGSGLGSAGVGAGQLWREPHRLAWLSRNAFREAKARSRGPHPEATPTLGATIPYHAEVPGSACLRPLGPQKNRKKMVADSKDRSWEKGCGKRHDGPSVIPSSQFLLLHESQATPPPPQAPYLILPQNNIAYRAQSTLHSYPLFKTPLNTQGVASAPRRRPLETRIEPEIQRVFLCRVGVQRQHPRAAQRGGVDRWGWADPAAGIGMCRRAPSPTVAGPLTLSSPRSHFGAWPLPALMDGMS